VTAIFDRRRLQSHVRIWRGEVAVGSGFVVGPRHVMTCAHVVADALPGERGRLLGCREAPDAPVKMDMLLAPGHFFHGRVLPAAWHPEIGEECEEIDDIAVLELIEGALPAQALPVGKAREVREGDWIVGLGVAPKLASGVAIRGRFQENLHNRFLIHAEAVDEAARPGCSGAAAWNSSRQGLAGMVAEMQQAQTGRVIPVDLLDGIWSLEWEDALRAGLALLPPEPSDAALELEGLNRLAAAPATRHIVLLYGSELRRTSECANTIGALKRLHDLIDQLRRTVYSPLRSIARRLPGPDAFRDLAHHRGLFLELRKKIVAAAEHFDEDAFPWIDEQLACAADDLKAALTERREALVESAGENLRQVVETELTSLDSRIADATRQLDLVALIAKLESLQAELATNGGGGDPAALARDIATLAQTEARAAALIRLHHDWQRIDAYLNALENALAQSVDMVATMWRNLARRLDKVSPGEDMADVAAAAEAVAAAIEARDSTGIAIAFPDLATCLRDRFFAVDRDLLDECERVRTVGASLSAVVDKLDGRA